MLSKRTQSLEQASISLVQLSMDARHTSKANFAPRKRSLQLAKCDRSRSIAKPFRDSVVFGSASTGVEIRTYVAMDQRCLSL